MTMGLNKKPGLYLVLLCSVLFVFFQLYFIYYRPISPLIHGIFFVTALISIGFLTLPFRAGSRADGIIPWFDCILAVCALIPLAYALWDYEGLLSRSALPNPLDVWVGLLLIALLLETTRRAAGLALPLLAGAFILFAAFNGLGIFSLDMLPTISVRRIVGTLVITELGIFSEVTQVAIKWIFIFLVFGQALLLGGGQKFFTELSFKLTGKRKGGPAYVACVSSALFGSLSGSNMANVMTTGQFTIPLMKRAGYKPSTAAAIETVASTGGALTPPVMAAGALIMAELTGITYMRIIEAAVIPAFLFYLSLMIYTYGITQRSNIALVEIPDDLKSYPKMLLAYWPVIGGFGYLIYRIVTFYPLELAAFEASLILLAGALVTNREQLKQLPVLIDTLHGLVVGIRDIGLCCASAGIIVGIILLTGMGVELSGLVVSVGQGSLIVALFLTMLVTIVLGMGVPGIAAYVIAASVISSSLVDLGVPALGAHMFIFYFSLFAGITPPVALTSFAAAGLAKADPFKTSFEALVIALPTYFVAYYLVYQPALLMEGPLLSILSATLMGAAGVSFFAIGTSGYLFGNLTWASRAALMVAGLALIETSWQGDLLGIGLFILVLFFSYRNRRSNLMMETP
jgi:TRAP transporter 4TM/12TM fusion protein